MALSQKILENFYISNINIPNHYPEQKILISVLNKWTTYSNFLLRIVIWILEYLCWRRKIFPVFSELKPPLSKALNIWDVGTTEFKFSTKIDMDFSQISPFYFINTVRLGFCKENNLSFSQITYVNILSGMAKNILVCKKCLIRLNLSGSLCILTLQKL